MRIVLTNDDGCDAPGLCTAFEALRHLGSVHVVAPNTQRSACSHTITLGRAIIVQRIEHETFGTLFAVDGTPADCVRLAVAELVPKPVDLVISGINRGANAGVDIYYSGTVAGAREAAFLGIKAIAVSQAIRAELETDWAAACDITRYLVEELIAATLPSLSFWNVNLPAPIPADPRNHVHHVPVAAHPIPLKFDRSERDDGSTAFTYGATYWLREVSVPSDYSVIRDGGVAVTAIAPFAV